MSDQKQRDMTDKSEIVGKQNRRRNDSNYRTTMYNNERFNDTNKSHVCKSRNGPHMYSIGNTLYLLKNKTSCAIPI